MIRNEELEQIVRDSGSVGRTPRQTLSRVLQELRDLDELEFMDFKGTYLLLGAPFIVEQEEMNDNAIDIAIKKRLLQFDSVDTIDSKALARRRRGQSRLRQLTLENYDSKCAFCDISNEDFLIAGHISRWADDPAARGALDNIICVCRFHDALFEAGYISLTDDYSVLKRGVSQQALLDYVLDNTTEFRSPRYYKPSPYHLEKHRERVGFQ